MKSTIKIINSIISLILAVCIIFAFVSCNAVNFEDNTADSNALSALSSTEESTEKSAEISTEETTTQLNKDPVEITPCPWDNESLPMPENVKYEIQISCLKEWHGVSYEDSNYVPEQVWVVCYGIFDNTYCVMTWVPDIGYLNVTTKVEVGEHTFIFDDSNTMIVYSEGKLYSLAQAYETGKLDDTELEELYNYYNKSHFG